MKVVDAKNTISALSAPAASEAGENSASPPGVAPAAAKISTDDAKQLNAAVATGMNMAASERALRIQSLTQEVRSGTYAPNVSRLADEILASAELDARLARSFH